MMSNIEGDEPIKKPVGRPRLEQTMNPEWYNMIIQAGKDGKHSDCCSFARSN